MTNAAFWVAEEKKCYIQQNHSHLYSSDTHNVLAIDLTHTHTVRQALKTVFLGSDSSALMTCQ